jgi:hypothetical protein
MALSRHQVDTLIKLVEIEIKILDDYPDDGIGARRIPQLEAVRTELVDLTTVGSRAGSRARSRNVFAGLSWKKIRPWNRFKAPPVPEPPQQARVAGGTGAFWLKPD